MADKKDKFSEISSKANILMENNNASAPTTNNEAETNDVVMINTENLNNNTTQETEVDDKPIRFKKDRPSALSVDPSFTKDDGNNASPAFPGEEGLLQQSLFNRFALYNYQGFYGGGGGSLADYYTDYQGKSNKFRPMHAVEPYNAERVSYDDLDFEDEDAVTKDTNIYYNKVNERLIIDYYNNNFPSIPYSANDFLYNKYFQQIPANHLITLRRFAMPCEDNIFLPELKSLSISTATTYFGETAGNKLDEILNFKNVGISWKEQTAQLQDIQAGNKTKGPGIFDKGNRVLSATLAGINASKLYTMDKFGTADPMQKYDKFVLGPVNVIDKTHTRDRGINFSNDFSLNFEYELKSWYLVNPKIAMLDILSNLLIMTTNNGDFWGGSWRYSGGQSQSFITDLYGDSSLLRSGDFIGYASSFVHDVVHGNSNKGIKGITGLFGDGSGGFSFKSIIEGVGQLLQNLLQNKIGSILDDLSGGQQYSASEVPKALLSGEPTGYWHVVVGNPLNPIALMGNMICDKGADFKLGGGLGYDDFPMEFSASISLKHGKPRDRSDIESMFNAGKGRIYSSPTDDVANIEGKEVEEYGVIGKGFGYHEPGIIDTAVKSTKSYGENSFTREHIANAIALVMK